MLARLTEIMRGLRLDPARMRANLDLGGGLIMAEAVMLDLGVALGRQHAHDAVYDAAQDAFTQGKSFGDLLAADPRVTAHMTPDQIKAPARPHRLHRPLCRHGARRRHQGTHRRHGVADMTELDVDHLRSWIGRQETLHDQVTRFPIAALSATLDRDDPPPQAGDPLPPLWHWLYFLPTARQSILGPDGHPARGGFLPPVPLPRRMWAGGRFTFHQPLRVDEPITRTSTVQDVTIKHGRNGALCFVLVKHEVSGPNGLALVEEHDIVYRDNPQPNEAPAAPQPGAHRRHLAPRHPPHRPAAVPLLRADLQQPSHPLRPPLRHRNRGLSRPHRPRPADRHPADRPAAPQHRPAVATFRFRAVSPLFDIAPFSVHGAPDGKAAALWARNPDGHLAMEAEATF